MTTVQRPETVTAGPGEEDALVLEAGSGVVLQASPQLLAWSGFEADEVVGRPVWDTLATGSLAEALQAGDTAYDAGVLTGPLASRDGTVRESRWTRVVLDGPDDRPDGRVVLTGLTPPEPATPGTLEEPSVLDHVTRGLLETLSHELRTPVASVSGYAELLREGEGGQLTMMQRKFVGAITRNSERLRGLADQLLLIGSLENNATRLQMEVLDLRDIVSSVRVSHAASGLERVDVDLRPGERALLVRADRHRLVQVVEELVANAAKFTLGSGRVVCSARLEDDHALVEVADDGVGIAGEDDTAALFLPFYRSRAVRVRGVPGAGLGLTFAAAVVRGHAGELEVVAGPERGTVVTVRLPLAEAGEDRGEHAGEHPGELAVEEQGDAHTEPDT